MKPYQNYFGQNKLISHNDVETATVGVSKALFVAGVASWRENYFTFNHLVPVFVLKAMVHRTKLNLFFSIETNELRTTTRPRLCNNLSLRRHARYVNLN